MPANRLVFLFFACFFILMSAGRISSGDAGTQVQATMLLVTTGHLGTKTPPLGPDGNHGLWVKNSQNVYYQCHDIGNIVLMLPAAWIGSHLSHIPDNEKVLSPPFIVRFGVALTYAIFAALGCTFLFRTLFLFYQLRVAFLLTLTFALATFFCVYAKSAWDVMGASIGVCMLLYYASCLLVEQQIKLKEVILTVVSLVVACSFRFSMLPFLILGVISIASRHKLNIKYIVSGTFALIAGLLPSLIYNEIRMGSPVRPATTAPQFAAANSLTGNIVSGFFGLVFSPNRGLLFFAPVFLLLFVLPFVWKRIPNPQRVLISAFGLASFLYVLLISKIPNWGAFGWGPRYLVPILPILYFSVCAVMVYSEKKYRPAFVALILLSVLINIAPVATNWRWSSSSNRQITANNAKVPRQIVAAWGGLGNLIQGKPLPAPAAILHDPIRSESTRLPDFWIIYLMAHSRKYFAIGLVLILILFIPCVWSFQRLTQKDTPASVL